MAIYRLVTVKAIVRAGGTCSCVVPRVDARSEKAERKWLDLRTLTGYACVSERTLREWIHRSENPLTAVQVGNKLLVRKSVFDQWLTAQAILPSENVNVIVEDVMRRLRD